MSALVTVHSSSALVRSQSWPTTHHPLISSCPIGPPPCAAKSNRTLVTCIFYNSNVFGMFSLSSSNNIHYMSPQCYRLSAMFCVLIQSPVFHVTIFLHTHTYSNVHFHLWVASPLVAITIKLVLMRCDSVTCSFGSAMKLIVYLEDLTCRTTLLLFYF